MQTSLRFFIPVSCFLVSVAAQGCKTLPLPFTGEKEADVDTPPVQVAEMQLPIGTIHHVDPEAGFVLIRTSRITDIVPDTKITVYGNGGVISAVLKSGAARRGQFVTADIVEGMPVKGDQCTMSYTPNRPGSGPGPATGADDIQVLE